MGPAFLQPHEFFFNLRGSVFVSTSFFFLNLTCLFFHLTLPHMSFFQPHSSSFQPCMCLWQPVMCPSISFRLASIQIVPFGSLWPLPPPCFCWPPNPVVLGTLPLPVCAWWPVWPVTLWACVFVASVFFFGVGSWGASRGCWRQHRRFAPFHLSRWLGAMRFWVALSVWQIVFQVLCCMISYRMHPS